MRTRVALLVSLAALAAGVVSPSVASAAGAYRVEVSTKSPTVRYFGEFTYDTALVQGPNAAMARTLTRKVTSFTRPWADEYLKADAKTLAYLKRAQPAYFNTRITPTPGCLRGHVCVSQGSSFSTPLIAGSITDIHARAWSTKTGKKATLSDFVPPSQLDAFTQRVKRAIRADDCYYGFDIDLPPRYSSFANWVPLESGIGVWFPEYQFGCQVMELRVRWS